MIFRRAHFIALFCTNSEPFAAALALMPGLKADIRALQARLAETRAALVALREFCTRTRPPARSRGARKAGTSGRMSGHSKEMELT
jgi:hypothetical protein